MTTTQTTTSRNPLRSTNYLIADADWQSGQITVTAPDGTRTRLTAGELREASTQDQPEIARVYRDLSLRASRLLAADRTASIRRCTGHVALTSRTTGYDGIERDDNPMAAGCITTIETCRCGAERRTNVNQRHVATDGWQ